MKGVVFCEFVAFVESVAGVDVADQMIVDADPPSGGAYTAVGAYDSSEMVSLVAALSRLLNRPAPELVRAFGRHLFGRLAIAHPELLAGATDPLDFLETVEGHIHVEVKKLYPDAELPTLETERLTKRLLRVDYRSCRPFGDLCIGLIEGCADHFDAHLEVQAQPTPYGLGLFVANKVLDDARRLERA